MDNVKFHEFWINFDPEEYFLPLLKGIDLLQGRDIHDLDVNIEFHSVFRPPKNKILRSIEARVESLRSRLASSKRSEKPVFRIWYTAENRRPAAHRFDAMLSFDKTDPNRANFRLPYWWLLFPELVGGPPMGQDIRRLGAQISLQEALEGRHLDPEPRDGFACGFFGRMWYPRRDIIAALGAIGQVDLYGPGTGRPVGTKLEVATHYRYVICPENDLYPGYITEKALEAWAAGSIPIYWGQDSYSDLNPEAIINLAHMDSLDDLVDTIRSLDNDPERIAQMRAMPILNSAPDIPALRAFLNDRLTAFIDAT